VLLVKPHLFVRLSDATRNVRKQIDVGYRRRAIVMNINALRPLPTTARNARIRPTDIFAKELLSLRRSQRLRAARRPPRKLGWESDAATLASARPATIRQSRSGFPRAALTRLVEQVLA
jgi:hypothetical protein